MQAWGVEGEAEVLKGTHGETELEKETHRENL